MRFWISGPRLFGGLIRPGISFGLPRAQPDRAPVSDFVYVVAGDHGLVKIGISTNPAARLATLQTASPHRLRLAFTSPTYGNAFAVEQEAHRILAAHRASGEWFNCSPDLATAAIFGAADRLGVGLTDEQAPPRKRFRLSGWMYWAIGLAAFYAYYLYHLHTCGYYCG